MPTLTTSYQLIGTGGTQTFGATTARIDLYAKYNSQSIPNNTSNWSIEARLVMVSGSYIGDYTGTTLSLSGDNISYSTSKGTGNFTSQTLGSASGTTTHNTNGTKSVSASASMQFKAWGKTLTVSGSADLPTIPRYANITSLNVTSRTETSISLSFTTDKNAWIFAKVNNGPWLNGGEPFVSNAKSGSFTITGLNSNTNYTVTVLSRADGRYGSLDTTKSIATSTYSYPYCTNSPNFIIGESLTLDFYNPLGRAITITGLGNDNSQIFTGTTSGTKLIGFNDSTSVANQYASIPNSKSGTYKVAVTYESHTNTRNNGNTYTINESECYPIFENTDFTYRDINSNTILMTNDNQILVDNYSICEFNITNRATAQKGATIDNYVCYWGDNYTTYLEQNMELYWKKTFEDRFNISYNSSVNMNTVSCTGEDGWECLYFPLRTMSGKTYKFKFDYYNPDGYTPLSGKNGVPCQILTRLDNSENINNQIAYITLNPTANPNVQNMEIEFTATSNLTYINFNFGYADDFTTTTIYLNNFELEHITSTGNTLKVEVIDSRGLSTIVTKTITNIPYVDAFINNISTQRKDGIDQKTYLSGKFTIYNGSWNNSDNTNYDNRLKYVGYSVYTSGSWSNYYDITNDVLNVATTTVTDNIKTYEFNYSDEVDIHANGSSGGFDIGTEYQIKVIIKDGNNSYIFVPTLYEATANTTIDDGTIATCLHKDSNGKYHLGINCMSDDNYMVVVNDNPIIDNNGKLLIDLIYPVGSIYMSVNSTNPSTLFGGTWQQLEDRFLLGAGTTYTAGSTGGNMPTLISKLGITAGSFGGIVSGGDYAKRIVATAVDTTNEAAYWNSLDTFGYDGLPPYLTVYMWKRTA